MPQQSYSLNLPGMLPESRPYRLQYPFGPQDQLAQQQPFGGQQALPYSMMGGPSALNSLDQYAFTPTGGISDLIKGSGFTGSQKSAKDIAGHMLRFADMIYGKFEPLENWMLNFYGDIASGGGKYLNQMLAPGFNALSSQLPQAQRRIADTTPMGGGQIEQRGKLEENLQGAQSQMTSQLMNWALGRLLDTGEGVSARVYPFMMGGGQLAKDPPKQSGGGS